MAARDMEWSEGIRKFFLLGSFALIIAAEMLPATCAVLDPRWPLEAGHVRARLVSEERSIRPGRAFSVGLLLRMEDGWHTYWKNPGDSGLPTTVEWSLPPGFSASPLQWPAPERIPASGIVSFGYTGEVLLIASIQPPADLRAGKRAVLDARAGWLECREECMPGSAVLRIELPVAAEAPPPDPAWAPLFARTRRSLPRPSSDWRWSGAADRDRIILRGVYGSHPRPDPGDVFFFPDKEGVVDHSADQSVSRDDRGLVLELRRSKFSPRPPSRLRGVLRSSGGWDLNGRVRALLLDVPLDQLERPER